MDTAVENQILRGLVVCLVVVVIVVVVSLRFLKSQLRVAELATASNTRVKNALDAPTTVVELDLLVERLPPVDEAMVVELWGEAIESTLKLIPRRREREAYHPVLLHILELITARSQGRLRLHREATIALDGREPDVCWTPDREAYVTGVSALPIFEIKSIRAAEDAAPQLHSY